MSAARTPFDDIVVAAAAGQRPPANALAGIKPPPDQTASGFRSRALAQINLIAAMYAAGQHGDARRTARDLRNSYSAAFGDDGAPANAEPGPDLDTLRPDELANLIPRA